MNGLDYFLLKKLSIAFFFLKIEFSFSKLSLRNLVNKTNKFDNSFLFDWSMDIPHKEGNCLIFKWNGFLSPISILKIVNRFRKLLNGNQNLGEAMEFIHWVAITVWGFSTSPISWKLHSHSHLYSGENDYTLFLLPQDNCYILKSVSSSDTFSS